MTSIPSTTGFRAGIKADDVQLAYGIEAAWGVPATKGQALRATSESLASGEQTKRTGEFTGSRAASKLFRTALQAGGSINGLLSAGTIDDLLASVMGSTWNGTALYDGGAGPTTDLPTFLTFEKNLGGLLWLQYPGSLVQKLSLSCRPQSEITWQADILSQTENELSASGFTSKAPIGTSTTMKYGPALTNKSFNGSTIPMTIDQIDLTIENVNAARQYGDGSFGAVGMDIGQLQVSGSFRAYFNGRAMYDAFVNQVVAPLSFGLTDSDQAANSYLLSLPAVRLSAPTQPMTGRGSDLMQTFTFQAQQNTAGNTLTIVRTPSTGVAGSFSYNNS